jgi:hypothetical protein
MRTLSTGMIKRLITFSVLVLVTVFFVNLINAAHHTAVFHPCPSTDYCSDLGRAQQGDPVRITYSGWPFKVKIGNPDWCAKDVCEVNNFHPDYQWEFLVYNAVILSVPTAVGIMLYIYRHDRRLAKKLFITAGMIIVSLVLGWFTMFTFRSTIVWQNTPRQFGGYIKSGIPFPSTLDMVDYDCNAPSCAKAIFRNDTSFWHSEPRVYANWIFWSLDWGVISWFILKRYAHTRH